MDGAAETANSNRGDVWSLPFEFQSNFEKWINDYNIDFPHQLLGNKTPQQMMSYFVNRKSKKEVSKVSVYSLIFA